MTRGRHTQAVDIIEVPEAERARILREFPGQNPRGVEAFVKNGLVDSESPTSSPLPPHAVRCSASTPSADSESPRPARHAPQKTTA